MKWLWYVDCKCEVCARVWHDGLVVHDKQHADVLYCAQGELGLRYADWKE